MVYVKKLIFAIPFLLSIIVFYIQAEPIVKDPTLLFAFDFNLLLQLIYFAFSITVVSYFFIIFGSFASDWKIVGPIAFIASISTLIFFQPPIGYFLAVGLFLSFCATFALLLNKLTKDPSSFHPSDHINKPAKQLVTIIVLITTALVYISTTASSNEMVLKVIDSVVNLSTEFMNTQQQLTEAPGSVPTSSSLPPETINLLRQNPALLKQYGLDPSVLNQFDASQKAATTQNIAVAAAKPLITSQITNFIKPYLPFIPFIIAFIFYLNFQFFTSITSLLFSPLVNLLFWILEKIEFIKFTTENRLVKKLVV